MPPILILQPQAASSSPPFSGRHRHTTTRAPTDKAVSPASTPPQPCRRLGRSRAPAFCSPPSSRSCFPLVLPQLTSLSQFLSLPSLRNSHGSHLDRRDRIRIPPTGFDGPRSPEPPLLHLGRRRRPSPSPPPLTSASSASSSSCLKRRCTQWSGRSTPVDQGLAAHCPDPPRPTCLTFWPIGPCSRECFEVARIHSTTLVRLLQGFHLLLSRIPDAGTGKAML